MKDVITLLAVAPGPIWTPLIPATFEEDKVKKFGANTLLKRAGQPEEVAVRLVFDEISLIFQPAYVFLASNEMSSYFTGQILHPNGGMWRGA